MSRIHDIDIFFTDGQKLEVRKCYITLTDTWIHTTNEKEIVSIPIGSIKFVRQFEKVKK